jgi:hypothetical protein
MAKKKMMCPFSNDVCKECVVYRGRHYLLCFYDNYQGYIKQPGSSKSDKDKTMFTNTGKKYKIPSLNIKKALDPFTQQL